MSYIPTTQTGKSGTGAAVPGAKKSADTGPYGQPWTGQIWNVEDADVKLVKLLFNAQPAQFKLEQVTVNGRPGYKVRPLVPTGVPTCFEPAVVLNLAGTTPIDSLNNGPLPAYDASSVRQYWDACQYVLSTAAKPGADVMRLEGEVTWCDKLHQVILYQVQGAIVTGQSFLVMDIHEEDGAENPDGAAIGHN